VPFTQGVYEFSEMVDITAGPGGEVLAYLPSPGIFTMLLSGHLVDA